MQEMNFIREPLLMVDDVSGMCIFPDLSDPAAEQEDPTGFYRIMAAVPQQTHSCNVAIAGRYQRWFDDTDALVTFERDVPIGVKTADCVPILLYSPAPKAVGVIHAGWKGTIGGIVDNTLDLLSEHGVDMSKLQVAFGPSISKESYEVDRDLAESFISAGFGSYVSYPLGEDEKPHIDLQGVNMERLVRRGVKRENIRLHGGCTAGSERGDGAPLYASHRRSGGAPARMLSCIMLLEESEMEHYRRLFRLAAEE